MVKREFLFSIQALSLLVLLLLFLNYSAIVHAAANQNINATVKIGVCGNGIAEDNEDCEDLDLKSKTCVSIGYGGGTLSCDTSCTFNTLLCTPVVISEDNDDSDDSNSSSDDSETVTRTITQVITEVVYKYELPEFIKKFDLNEDNKIDASELYGLSKKWVDAWKGFLVQQVEALKEKDPEVLGSTTCDLNDDSECNLVDFSILMYYVDKE